MLLTPTHSRSNLAADADGTPPSPMFVEVATHGGDGHPDDVVFVATISMMVPRMYGAKYTTHVIRTRDPQRLAEAHYVGDVGGVYLHTERTSGVLRGQYDHHQSGGAGARPNGVPFAAAGLAWKHFGPLVVASVLDAAGHSYSGRDVGSIADKVDRAFIEAIDARDHGLIDYRSAVLRSTDHSLATGSFAEAIALLLRSRDGNERTQDVRFMNAVQLATQLLEAKILQCVERAGLAEVVRAARLHQQSGRADILLLEYRSSSANRPLRQAIAQCPEVWVAVFPSLETEAEAWRVVIVADRRLPNGDLFAFPSTWRGAATPELRARTGIDGVRFCRPSGDVAGTASREAALALASLVLRLAREPATQPAASARAP